jgi:RNA polymerase sigma factor (sigma-70 family)
MTEDEINLWKRYRQGDETALEDLTLFYLYLVKLWVNRIHRNADWANPEDLIQEGTIGLINAIRRFDPDRGFEFSTYAQYHISGAIYHSPELTRSISRDQYKRYDMIRKVIDRMAQELGSMPEVREVAEEVGLTVKQVENALQAMYIAFAGELPDTDELSQMYNDMVADQERISLIREEISQLDEREQRIIIGHCLKGQTDLEIANELGFGKSNVSKIRQRALRKLKKRLDERRGGGPNESE